MTEERWKLFKMLFPERAAVLESFKPSVIAPPPSVSKDLWGTSLCNPETAAIKPPPRVSKDLWSDPE